MTREDATGWGALTSKIRVGWNHEFLDGVGGQADFAFENSPVSRVVGGQLVSQAAGSTGVFRVDEPGNDYLALGLGLNADLFSPDPFEAGRISLNYESQLFRSDFVEHYFSGAVTFEF